MVFMLFFIKLLIDNAFEWMNLHPDVMSLILLSYLIIPNYVIFRYAPRYPRHTLPQGFFIQVFTAIVFLIINMFHDLTMLDWFTIVLGNVWLFFAYKQLFATGCGERCGAWSWHCCVPTCWH